jgi:hypothetical protein
LKSMVTGFCAVGCPGAAMRPQAVVLIGRERLAARERAGWAGQSGPAGDASRRSGRRRCRSGHGPNFRMSPI